MPNLAWLLLPLAALVLGFLAGWRVTIPLVDAQRRRVAALESELAAARMVLLSRNPLHKRTTFATLDELAPRTIGEPE